MPILLLVAGIALIGMGTLVRRRSHDMPYRAVGIGTIAIGAAAAVTGIAAHPLLTWIMVPVLVITAIPAVVGLWLWALVECLLYELDTGNDKVAWTIVIVFTTVIGAILYLASRRPRRIAELGR